MSGPRCGWLYENDAPGGRADRLLVLTENDWNDAMRDSVVVPVFRLPGATSNLFRVLVDDELYAECTRVQSIAQARIGRPVSPCAEEAWVRVRIGVRRFLDVDRRIDMAPKPAAGDNRVDWYPHQDSVHFAAIPGIPDDKLFAAVSDDDWNSTPGVSHCCAVRLTSRGPKAARERWEVPISGGWVVAGDVYALPYAVMEQQPPPAEYPQMLTPEESANIAARQKRALSLQ